MRVKLMNWQLWMFNFYFMLHHKRARRWLRHLCWLGTHNKIANLYLIKIHFFYISLFNQIFLLLLHLKPLMIYFLPFFIYTYIYIYIYVEKWIVGYNCWKLKKIENRKNQFSLMKKKIERGWGIMLKIMKR